jgi:hypothetical protein
MRQAGCGSATDFMQLLQDQAFGSSAGKRGPAGRAGCGRDAGAAVKTVFTLWGNARPNHSEGRAMLMLVTGIVIGFLVSTAVFAGMARIETY